MTVSITTCRENEKCLYLFINYYETICVRIKKTIGVCVGVALYIVCELCQDWVY